MIDKKRPVVTLPVPKKPISGDVKRNANKRIKGFSMDAIRRYRETGR